MIEKLLTAGDKAVRVDALSDLPAATFDVQFRALVREAAAEAVAVDGDEGRQHRRLGRGHELHVHEARGVRAHVTHEEVGLAEQLELRCQREGGVLVEVGTELLQTTAATAAPVRPSHIAACTRAKFDRDS
jgi:hypothetical protein